MYRSLSELHLYAREAFHFFESYEALPEGNGEDGRVAEMMSTPKGQGLSRVGCECAFHVLFGTCLSSSLLQVLLHGVDGVGSEAGVTFASKDFNLSRATDSDPAVDEATFLRFVTIYAEQEGYVQPIRHGWRAGPTSFSNGAVSGGSHVSNETDRDGSLWSWQSWALFESLAGPKGYIAADDLYAADAVSPFDKVGNGAADSTLLISGKVLSHTRDDEGHTTHPDFRKSLLTHVFNVLDRDGDGRLSFKDVQEYLASR